MMEQNKVPVICLESNPDSLVIWSVVTLLIDYTGYSSSSSSSSSSGGSSSSSSSSI
jgi:hypothetical protein